MTSAWRRSNRFSNRMTPRANGPDWGERILRCLLLNEPNDLIQWAQNAGKDDVASLSAEVFGIWSAGDMIAKHIVNEAAERLAHDAACCAARLASKSEAVLFILSGGVLLKQPSYAALFSKCLRQLRPKAVIRPLTRESVWGAVNLAAAGKFAINPESAPAPSSDEALTDKQAADLVESPTEQRNPLSVNLDKMSVCEAVELMAIEDSKIPQAIREQRQPIEKTINLIVRQLRKGGRTFLCWSGNQRAPRCFGRKRMSADLPHGSGPDSRNYRRRISCLMALGGGGRGQPGGRRPGYFVPRCWRRRCCCGHCRQRTNPFCSRRFG